MWPLSSHHLAAACRTTLEAAWTISPADAASAYFKPWAATDKCHLEPAGERNGVVVLRFFFNLTVGFDQIDLEFVLCGSFLRSLSSSLGNKGGHQKAHFTAGRSPRVGNEILETNLLLK